VSDRPEVENLEDFRAFADSLDGEAGEKAHELIELVIEGRREANRWRDAMNMHTTLGVADMHPWEGTHRYCSVAESNRRAAERRKKK
jgi:hypothetical protein